MRIRNSALAAAAALFLVNGIGHAAAWPDRPVRIIVPFSTGGGTDIQARVLAETFHKSTGQTFIVDNRPGASGLVGTQLTVQEPATGHTILFTTATLSINPTLYGERWNIDPINDLAPVSWITSTPLVLVVHPTVPAKSVKDLVALAHKQPGVLNAGVNTPGSTSHLSAEMLKQIAGLDTTIVPFKGGGPALVSLVAGEIDYLFATGPSAAPHIRSGRVRPLAVTTAKRSSTFPNLPTMNTIYPGFESDNWYAMFFRAGTPRDVVLRLNEEIRKALKTPLVKTFMSREALDPVGSSPEELGAHLKREMQKYAAVIRKGRIKLR